MINVKGLKENFAPVRPVAGGNIIVQATYKQVNSGAKAHSLGDLFVLYVDTADGEVEAGKITFSENSPKIISAQIDLSEYRNSHPLAMRIQGIIDKNFAEPNTSSELDVTTVIEGVVRMNDRYLTDLPIRTIQDAWVIQI